MLQPGQTYAVPATATAPVLKTGKPEALKITVGSAVAPPVGPPATTVSNVSLLGRRPDEGPAPLQCDTIDAVAQPTRSAARQSPAARGAPPPADTAPTNTAQ